MKKTILIYPIIVSVLVLFLTTNCKKEEPASLAVVSTTSATNTTATTATSGGNITSDGGATITVRGVCWRTTANPTTSDSKTTDGVGIGQFVSEITGLTAGLTYHVRAYATNSIGTAYGADITFSTSGQAPTSVTQPATNVSEIVATLNGTVNANYLTTIVTFEYGITTSYGQTVTATQSPVTGSSNTNVSAIITGLIEGTIYHFRVKAVNSLGTSDGSDVTFTTTPLTTVTDIDGNSYNVVTIGTQVWMKENLKTTKYNDGTVIPNITDNTAWEALTTGAYSDYDNTPSNSTTYGRLYNWYAVDNNASTKVASNGGKNVCPTGWHVPNNAEWTALTDYLVNNGFGYEGSGYDIGKSMAATSGWTSDPSAGNVGNDQASNNSSGFTALPSGYRYGHGPFDYLGTIVYWWSCSEDMAALGIYNNSSTAEFLNILLRYGFSIRCLRN